MYFMFIYSITSYNNYIYRNYDPNVVKAFERIQSAFDSINNRHKEVFTIYFKV